MVNVGMGKNIYLSATNMKVSLSNATNPIVCKFENLVSMPIVYILL